MRGLETILFALLLIAVFGPLLLLSICGIALYFKLRIPSWLIDTAARAVSLQWLIGGWLNLAGGLAIAVTGIWLSLYGDTVLHRGIGFMIFMLGGLWRAWVGGSIIWNRIPKS